MRWFALLLLFAGALHLGAPDPIPNARTQFGAEGNGVADDTAAINACLSYAKAHAMRCHAPAGKYRLTAPLDMANCAGSPCLNLFLVGDGWGVTTLVDNDTTHKTALIDLGGCDYCGVENLTITTDNGGPEHNTVSTAAILASPGAFAMR